MSKYLENAMTLFSELCGLYWWTLKTEYYCRYQQEFMRINYRNVNDPEALRIERGFAERATEIRMKRERIRKLFVKHFFSRRDKQDEVQLEVQSGGRNVVRTEPPKIAEFMVGLFAKKRYRQAILSDLAEGFDSDLTAGMSVSRANRRYWSAAVNSIVPQALAAIKRIGLVGLVFDYARRWMG
jgi:hypothetical protein